MGFDGDSDQCRLAVGVFILSPIALLSPNTHKDHVDVGVSLISNALNFHTTQLSTERSQHFYLVAAKINVVLAALREQLQQSEKRPPGEASEMDHYRNVPSVSLPVKSSCSELNSL